MTNGIGGSGGPQQAAPVIAAKAGPAAAVVAGPSGGPAVGPETEREMEAVA
jgi:hypothetical protein